MKKRFLFAIIMLFAFSLYAQTDTVVKSFYDNGNVKEVLSFNSDKKLDGKCFTYTVEGIQTGVATYNNGVKDGEWKIWRENGMLAYEMYYENGEKVGIWKVYDENGNLIQKRDFS